MRRRPAVKIASHVQHRFSCQPFAAILSTLVILALIISQSQAANHEKITTSTNVHHKYLDQIGYRQNWLTRQDKLAKLAIEDAEPYLAYRIWSAMAEQGQADAAYKLGMLYDTGNGIERDGMMAAYWYRRAAENGHLHAQHNLAVAYANGDGVELNFDKALRWWKLAARSGNADSQYNLGIVYAMGVHGVKRNISMAKKWWRKAAMKGDPMAQYNLGTIYANGEGQVTSYCEAMRWWEKSAEKGVQQASWALEMIKTRTDYQSCW